MRKAGPCALSRRGLNGRGCALTPGRGPGIGTGSQLPRLDGIGMLAAPACLPDASRIISPFPFSR